MKKFLILLLCTISISAAPVEELVQQAYQAFQNKDAHKALQCINKALEQDPTHANALFCKANVLYCQNKGDQAIPLLETILAQQPHNMMVIKSLALITNTIGLFDDALHYYETVYVNSPSDEEAIIKLPPLYLRRMDWRKVRSFISPTNLWWYNETITGKKVLLDLTSQWNGLGDVLQIVRYAQHLKKAGARVCVKVRDELAPLLSLCPYIDQIVLKNATDPVHDKRYQLLADNCTACMGSALSEISDVPYLYADLQRVAHWKLQLRSDQTFKVGLCWQSTKMLDYFSNEITPGPRAMTLQTLESWMNIPGITFYSLQQGEDDGIAAFNARGIKIHTFENLDHSGTFMDTAAIMKNLDLIITVDTSIAHLAGGLGVPVWVMLAHAADFRWFSDRNDSPWYPTMRLFRQHKHYDWSSVISQIHRELMQHTAQEIVTDIPISYLT